MWNKAFEKIIEIKSEYLHRFGEIDVLDLNHWVEKLDIPEYTSFLSPLQTTHFMNFLLVRYGIDDEARGLWNDKDSVYRQCRSLVIDLEREAIALSPFRKFFNLNEVEENKLENVTKMIEQSKHFEVSEKLDGSMISARWYNDRLILSTSKSLDKNASWRLADAYKMIKANYRTIMLLMDYVDYTFVFEYISLKDAHTVAYKKEDEGLYLIGAINVTTGEEMNYSDVINLGKKYKTKTTSLENLSLEDVLKLMRTQKGDKKEGWVINIDGHKIKIKCDDYVNVTKVINAATSENAIIKAIADGSFDDVKSKLSEGHKYVVNEKAKMVFKYVNELNTLIEKAYRIRPTDERKDYMLWVDKQNKYIRKYLRMKYLGQEYSLLKTQNRYKSMKEIEEFIEKL